MEATVSERERLLRLSRIEAALRGQALLPDNEPGLNWSNCRAQKRIYIGQGRMGGTWVQCRKRARPGKRTCYWHRHLEEEETR
jgi:hypothetical protein